MSTVLWPSAYIIENQLFQPELDATSGMPQSKNENNGRESVLCMWPEYVEQFATTYNCDWQFRFISMPTKNLILQQCLQNVDQYLCYVYDCFHLQYIMF